MDKYRLTFILLFFFNFGNSQNFKLINSNISNSLLWEKQNDGKLISNKSKYILADGISQPIRFEHIEDNVPNLITSYFYYEEDSSMHKIEYEWDAKNYWDGDIQKLSATEQDALKVRYDEIVEKIENSYGKPETEEKKEYSKAISEGSYHRIDSWSTEKLKILLYIDISNKHVDKGAYKITPTYRIRLTFTNKTSSDPFDQTRIENSNLVAQIFFSSILSENYKNAKAQLSTNIRQTITNDQLKETAKKVRDYKGFLQYFNGVQVGLDGKAYLILMFKSPTEKKDPPRNFVKVIFDNNDKIIGVQPMSR